MVNHGVEVIIKLTDEERKAIEITQEVLKRIAREIWDEDVEEYVTLNCQPGDMAEGLRYILNNNIVC